MFNLKFEEIINELEALSNPEDREGMASFGISPKKTYSVRIYKRKISVNAAVDPEIMYLIRNLLSQAIA